MKEKRVCKVVQDLLPNYIENLTNEETNIFIDEHIKKCDECKNMLENMKKEVNIDDEKVEDREVKSIKKFISKFKIFRNILIIILFIYLVIVCRRFIILTNISNKANKFNLDNYYSRIERMTDVGIVLTQETYHKDSVYLIKSKYLSNISGMTEMITYDNGNEHLSLIDSGTEKFASTLDNQILPEVININDMDFINKVIYSFFLSIHRVKLAEKDCYLIKWNDSERFIDANTGMTIKLIHNTVNTTSNYYYECNVVTDEDVKKPDTTGYEILE